MITEELYQGRPSGWNEHLTDEQTWDLDPFEGDDDFIVGHLEIVEVPADPEFGYDDFTVHLISGQPVDPSTVEPVKTAVKASAEEFINSCHSPEDGKFCETGNGSPGWHNPDNYGTYNISMEPEDVDKSEEHYGRKETAPEMGGVQWAYEGQSPPITSAAEHVLQGYDFDPNDRYLDYNRHQYDAADTILKTIENESSDVTLYSGHRRDRETIDAILQEGVSFPLVATSPSKDLADSYAEAWRDHSDLSAAIVYEFPPGSQAGFYRFNEHIATGEYKVVSHKWSDDKSVVDIKLEQTQRSTVPEKKPLYEEED